ncbi:cell division protein ZapA [Psychrobacter sp. 1U2]|uniref:cell division protein ZapA n=1 Tax=Psychrobacter sp. 1U2 TaxID=3453577 RepID=UPI003F465379
MTDNRTDSQNPALAATSKSGDTTNKSDTTNKNSTVKADSNPNTPPTQRQDAYAQSRVVESKAVRSSANANGPAETTDPNKSNDMTNGKSADKTKELQNKKPENKNLESKKPESKKIDIVIAGASYPIFCPADEEQELRAAEKFINDFATAIKKDAPKLNQENLLVLSCLNLYEQINAYKTSAAERQQQSKQNEQLLNKIMQEAQSVL